MAKNRVYAGIDIGGTNIKFGLVDETGKVLYKERKPTLPEKGPTPLMHLVTNISERLLYHAAEEEYPVDWVGIGSPGAVDFKTGQVVGPCPNIEGWQGMKIGENLRERLNLPVYVDNDVNAMALAETKFGAGMGASSVVCVTVGTGIGGGIVIDGKVWRGHSSSAAEIGHMTIDYDGPVCKCGQKGCTEVFTSSESIISRVKSRLRKEMTPAFQEQTGGKLDELSIKKVFAAGRKADPVALEVIEETAGYLGAGIAGVVNFLNPEVVVIGGGIIEGGAGFLEAVAAEIRRRAFGSATEKLKIVKAALGNDAGFIGAALLGEAAK